ncbi:hypothetical protein [Tessaracoccus flavus]|uniref:Uncharacterized protein n=1 Tax=Tessaracoccus flavus TaxID=1610493 RepID=A0A1Q2CGU9_9ACTN|nr:hypothetical protein [Tessaracoccus flavus]AQP45280.1 hypothetical protein RPIT_11135 [Tessaracoccus flavus]SDY50330.1 hypothetical protein SAMN05428934_10277 [Tessaracoccus flavus]
MQTLVVCAVSIDDVRDIFRADEALAARLRALAADTFSPPTAQKRRWFGPVLRHDEVRVDPAAPTHADMDAVLTGSFVAPDRLPQAWTLVATWVQGVAAASAKVPWNLARTEQIEFDLARAGLNSDYALRNLAERDLGIPLRRLPDQIAGYAKHVQVVETLDALRSIDQRPEFTPEAHAVVDQLVGVLETAANDPHLDLVAFTVPTNQSLSSAERQRGASVESVPEQRRAPARSVRRTGP